MPCCQMVGLLGFMAMLPDGLGNGLLLGQCMLWNGYGTLKDMTNFAGFKVSKT